MAEISSTVLEDLLEDFSCLFTNSYVFGMVFKLDACILLNILLLDIDQVILPSFEQEQVQYGSDI